ncbi:phage portal protein [Massilia sp. P8910]|uniref:phage portal protein n=1 Tax=Massilia antarctica TaxID=2765360 RepID=UPI001E4E6091|nr:phage portal protein [Massilia antarctica]MCE3608065.1 phage portal protein [Massilia antarctica]
MFKFAPFNSLRTDKDFPERQSIISKLTAVLNGRHYDGLVYDFDTEYTPSNEYIPLRNRQPAVRFNLCKTVVDDSVSMLFSEGHFPTVHSEDETVCETLKAITKEAGFNAKMIEAATVGSVGSVAIQLMVLRNRVYLKAFNTQYLTPTFDDFAPDTLLKVREQYKCKGAALAAKGYPIPDDELCSQFWFVREWDEQEERFFVPRRVGDNDKPEAVDAAKTVKHGFGFVPMVWVRNLPGGDEIDGACTFAEAIQSSIQIDYQLSQAGRGLKYSADPKLVLKDPSNLGDGSQLVGGAANALVVSSDGDAKLLEINGNASKAVIEYVRCLREFAIEAVHGNRVSPEKLAAASSGKAMELMNQSLVWLADRLRISYGEGALLSLYRMIARASHVMKIECNGKPIGELSLEAPISLSWNDWYDKTAADNLSDAQTLTALTGASIMSKETAVRTVASEYDVEDAAEELARIESDANAVAERQNEQLALKAKAAPPQSGI